MSIIKLSLLMLLTRRIMEVSALFVAGDKDTFPKEDAEGIPTTRFETDADVVCVLIPLTSLLIVLLEPELY